MSVTKLRRAAIVLLVAILAGAALVGLCDRVATAEPKDKKADRETLQGTWSIVSIDTGDGKKTADDKELKTAEVVFKGDKITVTMGSKTMELTFKVDQTRTPKEIDMTEVNEGKAEVHLGIYQLEGDTFKMCKSHPPQERPTEFATKEGSKWPMIVVLKRKTATEKKE